MDFDVRWAKREEWDEAMHVVWQTFLEFDSKDCSPEGIQSFHDFLLSERLKLGFLEGSYQLMVALSGGKVIGVGSLRDVNHLSLLFVDGAFQRNGVGRTLLQVLCEYLKNEVGECRISLTASPSAVGFYEKLGFEKMRQRITPPGIPVIFMEKTF